MREAAGWDRPPAADHVVRRAKKSQAGSHAGGHVDVDQDLDRLPDSRFDVWVAGQPHRHLNVRPLHPIEVRPLDEFPGLEIGAVQTYLHLRWVRDFGEQRILLDGCDAVALVRSDPYGATFGHHLKPSLLVRLHNLIDYFRSRRRKLIQRKDIREVDITCVNPSSLDPSNSLRQGYSTQP